MEKTVVELFAGVGGFHLGLTRTNADFNILWANQWARNALQADMVWQALQMPRSLETYAQNSQERKTCPHGRMKMTLHQFDFILDFKDFFNPRKNKSRMREHNR